MFCVPSTAPLSFVVHATHGSVSVFWRVRPLRSICALRVQLCSVSDRGQGRQKSRTLDSMSARRGRAHQPWGHTICNFLRYVFFRRGVS